MERKETPDQTTGVPEEPGFPGEVVDNIIDHLHDDSPSLAKSSLVCHAWLPSCRYHLFHTIFCCPTFQAKDLCHLLDWLLASPDVRPYINTLLFMTPVTHRETPPPEVSVEDMGKALSYLPSLRSLCVFRVSLSSSRNPWQDSYVSPINNSPNLESLAIMECKTSDDTLNPLFFFLGLFRRVAALQIQDSTCSYNSSMPFAHLLELAQHFHSCRMVLMFATHDSIIPGMEGAICSLFDILPPDAKWPLRGINMMSPALILDGSVARMIEGCKESLEMIWIDIGSVFDLDLQCERPLSENRSIVRLVACN